VGAINVVVLHEVLNLFLVSHSAVNLLSVGVSDDSEAAGTDRLTSAPIIWAI
jgi:hypothetical protein